MTVRFLAGVAAGLSALGAFFHWLIYRDKPMYVSEDTMRRINRGEIDLPLPQGKRGPERRDMDTISRYDKEFGEDR